MARAAKPQYLGTLKPQETAQNTWIHTVWVVDGGHVRIQAVKATSVEKKAIEAGTFHHEELEVILKRLE